MASVVVSTLFVMVWALLLRTPDRVVGGHRRTPNTTGCRLSVYQWSLPPEQFRSFACAECFLYIYGLDPLYNARYVFTSCPLGIRVCDARQRTSCNCANASRVYNLPEFDATNTSTPFWQLELEPRLPVDFLQLIGDCCRQADLCCRRMISGGGGGGGSQETVGVGNASADAIATATATADADADADANANANLTAAEEISLYCPATWDGWQCFPAVPAGTIYRGSCPYYSYGRASPTAPIDPEGHYSIKRCLPSGEWYQRNKDGQAKEWTEYGSCETSKYGEELLKYTVTLIAFGVSVASIAPALVVFSCYRSLRNHRIRIHRNLLVSFLLMGVFCIFNNIFFVQRSDGAEQALLEGNFITCRVLFTVQLRYLRLATYTWQMNEGLYLYNLLANAFAQQHSLFLYYFLGWVFPIIPTLIYAIVRLKLADSNTNFEDYRCNCWIICDNAWVEWITYGPCIISLLVNLVLMVIIMQVLITKLRHNPENEPPQYRKAVRATLVLLPVFGLHFFITIYRLRSVLIYDIVNRVLDGLQGFIVAMIVCYTNGEVIRLFRTTADKLKTNRACKKEANRSVRAYYSSHQDCNENPLLITK